MGRENDFSAKVRSRVSERAGHQCSFPDCGRSTSGPSLLDQSLSVKSGWACHIYPAAADGPRSKAEHADLDIRGAGNAIWMCEVHGSLIDKNEGRDYPPESLRKWKRNAELTAALRQSSVTIPLPAIDFITFPEQGLKYMSLSEMRIELDQFTVIESNERNPLQLIARCVANATSAPSIIRDELYGGDVDFSIGYRPGYRDTTRISIESGHLRYWDGTEPVDSIESYFRAILVDEGSIRSAFAIRSSDEDGSVPDDPDFPITRSALADPLVAEKIAASIRYHETISVREIRRSTRGWEAHCSGHQDGVFIPLSQLSGSEKFSVHVDLLFAAVRLRTESPLLIVIDNLLWVLDDEHLQKFDKVCRSLPPRIQVLVTDATGRVAPRLHWPIESLRMDRSEFPWRVIKVKSRSGAALP